MASAHETAVDDLLSAYRSARLQAFGSPASSEVMNDIRRSAAAARDALRAAGSPQAERIEEFLQATAREDSLQRAKNFASTGMEVTNTFGKAAGIEGLANLTWGLVVFLGVVGVAIGWFLIVNIAIAATAALAAAVPIGWLLSRGSMVAGNAMKSYEQYMSASNPGRQIINSVVVPAERSFFAVVPGQPVRIRTTTVSAAGEKTMVTAAGVALAVGVVLGLILGAGQG